MDFLAPYKLFFGYVSANTDQIPGMKTDEYRNFLQLTN